jgi:hypothetical protein
MMGTFVVALPIGGWDDLVGLLGFWAESRIVTPVASLERALSSRQAGLVVGWAPVLARRRAARAAGAGRR